MEAIAQGTDRPPACACRTQTGLIRFHTQVPGYRSQTILVATTLLDPVAYPLGDLVAL